MIRFRHVACRPISVAMLVWGMIGCAGAGSNQAGGPAPDGPGKLEVVNRSSGDMDIYQVRGGQRVRLGSAPGNETSNFTLAPGQLAGAGSVHFEAIPQAGIGWPVRSESIMPGTKGHITLDIPPN